MSYAITRQRWFPVGLILVASILVNSETLAADQSVIAPLASKSLLLDVVVAGDALIAVGERGHVLRSLDRGETWQQLSVPTRATLTGVSFADDRRGFAVGHDAVILRTLDGGESWTRVHYAPEEERPLLDVYAHGDTVLAIGAYGYYLESKDAGDNWESRLFRAEEPGESADSEEEDEFGDDFHLNHFAVGENGKWYIAAEAGSAYRSDDRGRRWLRLSPPYEGSFFGVLPLSGDRLLLFGLQGWLFYSEDAGDNWTPIETHTQATLTAATQVVGGGVAIVGAAGVVLVDAAGDNRFVLKQQPKRSGNSAVVSMDSGVIVMVGEGGVRRLSDVLRK